MVHFEILDNITEMANTNEVRCPVFIHSDLDCKLKMPNPQDQSWKEKSYFVLQQQQEEWGGGGTLKPKAVFEMPKTTIAR